MIWFVFAMIMGVLMPTQPAQSNQGEMISQLKRHEVQVLLKAGFTPKDTAERSGVSVDTVRRVHAEDPVTHTDDTVAHASRRIGRPPKAVSYTDKVAKWLEEDPGLPTQELLRRAKEAGYTGKKTAFYVLVSGLRPPKGTPIVRFEGLPGEFSQHDFGHVDVKFVDGRKKRVHFFASRLKYSRFACVTLVDNERVETIVRGLARDFAAFGGLPLMAVFDRPKTIVTKGGKGREVEAFNATFAQAIVDIGVGVEMCAPRSGNQKGTVERIVGWVKGSFFKPRKFQDEADLVAQLAVWHREVNFETKNRTTGEIPETRRQQELARLRPVKVFPENLALRIPVFVGPTAEVFFDGLPYSMPPEATHIAGTLFLYEDRLRIVAGRFQAEHRRRNKGEPPAPLPEHRAAKVAAVHGARARLYEKRQQVLNLGHDALTLLTEITHRSPQRSSRYVEELYQLLEEHGDDVLREAIGLAVRDGHLSVSGVTRALAKSARGSDGECHHSQAAQPRVEDRGQMALAFERAESKRGAT